MTPGVTETRSGGPARGSIVKWRSRAFGLDLEGDFPVSGFPPTRGPSNGHPTTIERVSTVTLNEAWRGVNATRPEESRSPDDRLVLAIDRDDQMGYRLTTADWGDYLLSPDGQHLQCAPPRLARWRRERFLTARALPLAATLRGLEVFHASAVSLGNAVVAMTGPRHIGKTSVAVNLVLQGASFVTDDLLALETGRDHILAHPGAAVMGVRPAEYRLIQPVQRRELGRFVQRRDKFFAEIEREERALPLGLMYFLDRRQEINELAIDELTQPDPRLLLASSFFNRVVHSPERLRTQLDLCAQLSHNAVICRVSVPPSVGASALAGWLGEHATARLGARIEP